MKEESKTRPWAALAMAVMFVLASLVSAAPARAAEERTVIPMGRAVGIKLFSDGVMVVGFSEVVSAEGSSAPARDCGLREGDIITHINREEVDSIEEVQSVLQEVGGKPMSIRAVRDDKTVQLTAQAVQCGSDGQYKLGAWIRDSMAGSAPSPSASPLPGGSALWATASTTWTPPSSCPSSPAPSCIRRSPM
ncbi:PDZ domain-containing protein [Flavonifractor plautii]|nr:PDZ domain-containing protein [Flavonifractor plautii]